MSAAPRPVLAIDSASPTAGALAAAASAVVARKASAASIPSRNWLAARARREGVREATIQSVARRSITTAASSTSIEASPQARPGSNYVPPVRTLSGTAT